MTCTCDNPARVWDKTVQAARKAYACEECHHPIAKGEHYARVGALHDGGWDTFRFCLFCLAFAEEAQAAGVCHDIGELYGATLGRLRESDYRQTPGGWVVVPPLYREGDGVLLRAMHGAEVREP